MSQSKSHLLRRRLFFGIAIFVLIPAGLLSRKHRASLPTIVGAYAGDILWAGVVYCCVSLIQPSYTILRRISIAMLVALAVELSQLSQAAWLVQLRSSQVGSLVLGHGFLWSDLVCYALGILLIALSEGCVRGKL